MSFFRRIAVLFLAVELIFGCSTKTFDPAGVNDAGEKVTRVEPLSWWVGMKTPLQLLVQGPCLGECSVRIENPGLGGVTPVVSSVEKAESPNYLFVNVKVSPKTAPGQYWLVFSKGDEEFKVPYEFAARREGSADRQSFTTADVIYLIMPDRFANGDPSNDSTPYTKEEAARWMHFGRHGGDIQGIIDHLDYIADLGATAIWNTPLLLDDDPHESYHGYACADYYHIDPRFGSNELYRELVEKSHEKGLKMIMDIVTNHCGAEHWWMKDLPFHDWVNQWPEYLHSNCSFSTNMDINASEIDLREMEKGWFTPTMVDMNLDNPYTLQYFKQWAIWWIEYANLDGLRVDTYPYNERKPMSTWNQAVLAEYPNLNIVGECWTTSVPQLAYWQGGNPNKDGFDSHLPSIMDFPLHNAICQGFPAEKVNWDEGMVKIYDCLSHDFAYQDLSHMLVFPSNHDTGRLGDIIHNDAERMKLIMTLIATVRGIPQFFSGDEMMFASADLGQGDGGLRVDFPGGWKDDRFNLFTDEGRREMNVNFDGSYSPAGTRAEVFDYVRKILNWRKTASAIHDGKTMHFLTRDNRYAYFRYNDAQIVFVYINNAREEVTVPWASYAEIASNLGAGVNVMTGETVDFSQPVTVGPLQALVVEF